MKRWLQLLIIGLLACSFSLIVPKISVSQHVGWIRRGDLAIPQRQQPPATLVQLAQQQYQVGKFSESLELLQQAQENYHHSYDDLQEIQVLALISLTQQKLGKWQAAENAIASGFDLLNNVVDSQAKQQVLAQLWNSQGHLELETGKFQQALASWQEAEKLYRKNEDNVGIRGSLINQAEALKNLGFYRRSCNTILQTFQPEKYSCESLTQQQLSEILSTLPFQSNSWQVTSLINLASSLLRIGKTSLAQKIIENNSLITQHLSQTSPLTKSQLLLTLGNIYKNLAVEAQEKNDLKNHQLFIKQALSYYQQLEQVNLAQYSLDFKQLQAQLNQLSLFLNAEQNLAVKKLIEKIVLHPNQLIYNRQAIYALINFSRSLIAAKEKNISINYSWTQISTILTKALQEAQRIDEKRAQAYALGYLGTISYKYQLQFQQTPEELLQQALAISQIINTPEISYLWQWELGQMYRKKGQTDQAIIAYQTAFNTLQSLRSDLVALNQEIQFSFRKKIAPLYQELAELLLNEKITSTQLSSKRTQEALNVIEALQLAELDNYFQDACLTFAKKNIEQIDPNAAVIYTIVFPKSLDVILSLPNQTSIHHSNQILSTDLEKTIQQLRIALKEPDRLLEVQELSQQIYNCLIKPFEKDLTINKPKTLVFVLDGMLQNIPMGVLYDGNKYLIEKYAIAVTPGLQLLVPKSPQPIKTLAAGVSQPRQFAQQSFSALNNVETELQNIKSRVKSQTLLNKTFTETNLVKELNSQPFSVLHLATHGQFSSDPNNTFIVLWDQLLKLQDFSSLLQKTNRINYQRNSIDLLVLSACETATGDLRAALGLAGMAVRTGASSTLASLWQISDESTTALMINFYQALSENPNLTKAEALRLAQLSLWDNSNRDWQIPSFWAAYVLVGNWL